MKLKAKKIQLLSSKYVFTKILILSFMLVVAISLFLIFRDPRYIQNTINLDINNKLFIHSEFHSVARFCSDLPMCFRKFSALSGEILVILFNFFYSKIFYKYNPHYIIQPEQYILFFNILASTLYRIIIFSLIIFLLYLLLHKISLTLVAGILGFSFTSHIIYEFILTSAPTQIYNLISLDQIEALRSITLMYFVYYDYSSLLITLTIILILVKNLENKLKISTTSAIYLGIIFTLFFEHLGILLALGYFLVFKKKSIYIVTLIFLSSLATIFVQILLSNNDESEPILKNYQFYFKHNVENINLILVQIIIVILVPIISSYIAGYLIKSIMPFEFTKDLDRAFRAVLAGLILIYLVGFFTSGIASEFSRQAFPFEFLAVIYFFLKGASSKSSNFLKKIRNNN